jgi:hypothetical protein
MVYVYGEIPPAAKAVNVTASPTWGEYEEAWKVVIDSGRVT